MSPEGLEPSDSGWSTAPQAVVYAKFHHDDVSRPRSSRFDWGGRISPSDPAKARFPGRSVPMEGFEPSTFRF